MNAYATTTADLVGALAKATGQPEVDIATRAHRIWRARSLDGLNQTQRERDAEIAEITREFVEGGA